MAAGGDKKHYEFTYCIQQVQFNNLGNYYLKIGIKSAFSDNYSGLWVRDGPSREYEPGHTATTDTVQQIKKKDFLQFKKNEFSFFLPKGFCKNDQNHDVFLLVEAFQVDSPPGAKPRRVGEAKYAIFPRTDKPRANLNAPPGEAMYKHTHVMALLRTHSTENLQQHCGRMKCITTFSQMMVPPVETPRLPSPPQTAQTKRDVPATPSPEPARAKTGGDQSPGTRASPTWPLRPSRTPSPTLGERAKTVASPLDRADSPNHRIQGLDLHVSSPGKEDIVVILHGAANLPSVTTGRPPLPFCAIKMKHDEDAGLPAQVVSRVPAQPTHSPSYEEGFVVEYDGLRCLDEVAVIQFCDKTTKEILVTYNLPVSVLWPFHQYHLEMIMPDRYSPSGVRVFATIMRRQATLPRDLSSPNYLALEVYVQGVEQRLKNPVGRMIAVARIVPDYYSYKWVDTRETTNIRDNLVRNGGVSLTSVTFPSPHPSLFAVSDTNTQGFPQMTLPCGPPEQPEWDHSFLFTHNRDKATLFTPSAALVIEFFQASKAMSDMSWRLKSPVGFATLLLDQGIYKQLAADGAKLGVQVRHLPIQGTPLKTIVNKMPTVGMVLKLITTERPSTMSIPSDPNALPYLQYIPQEEEGDQQTIFRSTVSLDPSIQPSINPDTRWNYSDLNLRSPSPQDEKTRPGYWVKQRVLKQPHRLQQDGETLPTHNAMESILPEYQYIFVDPDPKRSVPGQMTHITNAPRLPDDFDKNSLHLLDHQMHELEKYRTAVQKMGSDILTLRGEIRDLETGNSRLRRDLAKYNDSTRLLMDSQDLDGLTKPELAARYVALKQKLTTQTGELKEYKDRVQKLQNELIKRNDSEKDYLQMSNAHTSQNELLQKLQDRAQKVKKLEEACRKQEKVIEKMERLLAKQPKSKASVADRVPDPATEAVIAENRRLRADIDDLRDQNQLLSTGRGLRADDDEEKLLMMEKMGRAEGRIISLEKQLADNARKWGREKSDLLTKLQEAELGLRRTTTLNSKLPLAQSYDTAMMDFDPRRYSKAPARRAKYGTVGAASKYDPFNY